MKAARPSGGCVGFVHPRDPRPGSRERAPALSG